MKKLIICLFLICSLSFFACADGTVPETSYQIETVVYDDDIAGNSKEYFGFGLPGSATSATVWKMLRITYTGTDFVLDWADGNQNYDNEWDERASASYE